MSRLVRQFLPFVFVIAALLVPAPAAAQFDTATVLGTVTDQRVAPCPAPPSR